MQAHSDRDRLQQLIRERSYRQAAGEAEAFTLVSGKKSLYYFDLKATLLLPEGYDLAGKVIWNYLCELGLDKIIDSIGGLTLGADPLTYAVSHQAYLDGKNIFPIIVRKEAKGHGTKKRMEGYWQDCKNCLILDDVITTGMSSIKAMEAVGEAGIKVVEVLTLVDRKEGGREAIEAKGVKFSAIFDLDDFRVL